VHECPSIPLEDFERGRLKPLSYSREAISKAIVENIYRTQKFERLYGIYGGWRYPEGRSKRQKDAVDRFIHQGSWNLAQRDNLKDLNKFFDIFDDAYFGGLLKGYCRLEMIADDNQLSRRSGVACDGRCEVYWPGEDLDPRYAMEKPFILISINNRSRRDPFKSIRDHLEVLLHEMLHAIFGIYTCECENGCKQRHIREGGGGHWVEWQAAAKAIEFADQEDWCFLHFGFSLYRTLSLVSDIQLGLNIPVPAELLRVKLNIVEIRKMLIEFRQQRVREEKERRPKLKQLKSNVCLLHYREKGTRDDCRFHIDFPTLFEPTIPW
jgi:hypothetical protein